ncbi:VOC family protein [Flexivirga caeni]|uniref:VOC family protein n=1 Tax=Flexivirga caeni TaxID=2294115 RepID=UPI0013150D31|nr:VOC family protein [Flexivirga caeni]
MASVRFLGVRLDARNATAISTFWAELLGWKLQPREDGAILVMPDSSTSFPLAVHSADTLKSGQNRIHFDLTTNSAQHMRRLISRARHLGAGRIDVGQSPDETHTVLADPEGNEFCVIAPGNAFLADTGAVGAINCDGTQALGYFWSKALQWPLVWDQDQETAIQSPTGGSKLTWSGPPLMRRNGRDRLRFELCTDAPLAVAIAQLVSLGAQFLDKPAIDEAALRDPDSNEFHLTATDPARRLSRRGGSSSRYRDREQVRLSRPLDELIDEVNADTEL